MKNLLLLFTFYLLSTTTKAQLISKIPKDENGNIHFVFIENVEGVSKDILFTRVKESLGNLVLNEISELNRGAGQTIALGSINKNKLQLPSIIFEDKEQGQIASFCKMSFGKKGTGNFMNYTLKVSVKDSKIKYEFYDFFYTLYVNFNSFNSSEIKYERLQPEYVYDSLNFYNSSGAIRSKYEPYDKEFFENIEETKSFVNKSVLVKKDDKW
jgi:hypothetical protein